MVVLALLVVEVVHTASFLSALPLHMYHIVECDLEHLVSFLSNELLVVTGRVFCQFLGVQLSGSHGTVLTVPSFLPQKFHVLRVRRRRILDYHLV